MGTTGYYGTWEDGEDEHPTSLSVGLLPRPQTS